jgi:Raf kinase inhibitor-like YbhB/YbcL family protein
MQLISPAFQNLEPVPEPYTCRGPNLSPPLEFRDLPEGTASLVLMVEDVDAPANPWVHWLVFDIPPVTTGCEPGEIPDGGVEGIANGGTHGYEGPCPRYFTGTHHYHFKLYALNKRLSLPSIANRPMVLAAMEGHVLDQAVLIGLAEGDGSAMA